MIKKLIPLALCAMSFTPMSAQIAVTAGGTYSKWQDDFTSYRAGFNVGALYELNIDSCDVLVDAGLLLTNRGVKLDATQSYESNFEYDARTTLYSLHLPVNVGYKFDVNKGKINLIPKIGVYADCGLNGEFSQDKFYSALIHDYRRGKFDGKNPYTDIEDMASDSYKDFSRFSYGVAVGLTAYLSKNIFLALGYEHGLSEVWSSGPFNSKFATLYANVGYRF